MDILASLVKRQMGGGGSVRDTLRERSSGSSSGSSSGQRSRAPHRQAQHPHAQRPQTIDQAARSLEEMLGVETAGGSSPRPSPTPRTTPPAPQERQTRTPDPRHTDVDQSTRYNPFDERRPRSEPDIDLPLIRVMLAAAKSDGTFDASEQAAIMQQMGDLSDNERESLRREFETDHDPKQLAWDVPIGLEQAAYQSAVLSMKLDKQSEVQFLAALQHGLRLSPKWCNSIHSRYGQPEIFKV